MYKREWLNTIRGRAFVELEVKDGRNKSYIDSNVTIGDCGRQVTLDFDCNKSTRGERLKKVRKLITALQVVEKFLAEYKFSKRDRYDDL